MLKKRIPLTILALLMMGAAPSLAEPITQQRDLPAFEKIRIKGSMDANIMVGGSQSVAIRAEQDDQDRIKTSVKDKTLIIDMKGRFRSSDKLLATISVPNLDAIMIDGSSDASIKGIKTDRFSAKISGSGDIMADGTCGAADYSINGSGDLDMRALRCDQVAIEINGSGDADVYAGKSISVEINGSGDVEVSGKPLVKSVSISGSGNFEMHDGD
ncbi:MULTISPECIES: head GIN domain-containing protein [unclassified Iodidimonas]|jgi:hypothetical protein|uniref:head GIN domain-containing protein n=1 Tax=unclassified Iodidimonas TaxID=2626145 RepID=UPI002482F023|nr:MULTISPECIES: head GIN domain-containing protein [unclassified Iodidimonas]